MVTNRLPEQQLKQLATMIAEILYPRLVEDVKAAIHEELNGGKALLTCKQKAEQLGIKEGTLRKWVREGRIDAIKSGTHKQAKLLFRE